MKHEDGRKDRRGRKSVGVGSDVHPGHLGGPDGHPGLATLVETPRWWPFQYTTADNLKRLKREHAKLTVKRWLRMPPALF